MTREPVKPGVQTARRRGRCSATSTTPTWRAVSAAIKPPTAPPCSCCTIGGLKSTLTSLSQGRPAMTWANRVAWQEGMFLRAQHFQQQDRTPGGSWCAPAPPRCARIGWGMTEIRAQPRPARHRPRSPSPRPAACSRTAPRFNPRPGETRPAAVPLELPPTAARNAGRLPAVCPSSQAGDRSRSPTEAGAARSGALRHARASRPTTPIPAAGPGQGSRPSCSVGTAAAALHAGDRGPRGLHTASAWPASWRWGRTAGSRWTTAGSRRRCVLRRHAGARRAADRRAGRDAQPARRGAGRAA